MYNNEQHEEPQNSKLLLGSVGALLGALVGAIPWAIVSSFGWYASILGFFIAFLAIKAYQMFGGKTTKATPFIIILCVIIGVFAGEFLGIAMQIVISLSESGQSLSEIQYGEIFPFIINILKEEPEIMKSTLINLGIGFLFAGIGTFRLIGTIGKAPNTGKPTEIPAQEIVHTQNSEINNDDLDNNEKEENDIFSETKDPFEAADKD